MQNGQHPVVVITGASSGIGRATALRFAGRAAGLVLVARREEPLRTLAEECLARGTQAIAAVADVRDEAAVAEIARLALQAFGRIDVWVNDAAVGSFGFFEDTPPETFRQVLETNLFGSVYGARAALAQFRRQGYGLLVNVGSIASVVGTPYASAYVAAKHAVRGLGKSLRQELQLQGERDIHVCTVMPATIDTPFFQHAANYAGRATRAMPPIYSAERVARTITRLVDRPRREVFVGTSAHVFALLERVAGRAVERLFARQTDRSHLAKTQLQVPTDGSVFLPIEEGQEVSGGWKRRRRAKMLGGAGVAALAGWALLRPRFAQRLGA